MKEIFWALTAALLMSATVMAQETNTEAKQQAKPADKMEMVQKRTDEIVKRYGLNEEQAKQLLELNLQYADKMGPGRGQRPEGRRGMRGDGPRQRPDSALQRGMRPQREFNGQRGADFQKQREAYETELKKILTEEQLTRYKADRERRMGEGPRGRRDNGQREQRRRENRD